MKILQVIHGYPMRYNVGLRCTLRAWPRRLPSGSSCTLITDSTADGGS